MLQFTRKILVAAAALGIGLSAAAVHAGNIELLNVSYDPTRELYTEYNKVFARHYKETTGDDVKVKQSHGGSGKQARAVIDGLQADVATLALGYDVDSLHKKGDLVPADWQTRLPANSSPYTSTIVFLVRKGNPKGIKDWDDLARQGVSVITPDPKISGGARWNYLAAWGYALRKDGGDEAKAQALVTQIFRNVAVLDTGARGSTTVFVSRGLGDVLIAWENEALATRQGRNADRFEIVTPSISILAEPPVAVVDRNVDKYGTRDAAEAYLRYLYSDEAQKIIARNGYRPRNSDAAAAAGVTFPDLTLLTIEDFGGWAEAQQKHFADGGVFDAINKEISKR
jgi:sulfate transport system substrate-binding protein